MADTVDISLTWKAQVPMLVGLINHGDAAGREFGMKELNRLADIVDKRIGDLENLKKNLHGRDDFIVSKGLWGEFMDTLREPCPDCGIRGDHAYGCPISAKLAGEPDDAPECKHQWKQTADCDLVDECVLCGELRA